MSAVNSDIPGGTDGRNAESNRGAADSPKVTSSSELPRPANPGIPSFPFHPEKVPLHPIYTNGFGVALGGSVRQQPPQTPGRQHAGSTASVCSKSSRKSGKPTASQIQDDAKEDCCAHCALACLFCEFISLCSLALDCLGCRGCLEVCCSRDGGEPLGECCCGGEAGAGNCSCGIGCGMLQDCCGSSDCLEICMECCSICFPA